MNNNFELPFANTKDMPGLSPFTTMAMLPWMMTSVMTNMMMANAMTFWTMAARGSVDKSWPLGDSFDHVDDAPAEELLEHEHLAPAKFRKGKH